MHTHTNTHCRSCDCTGLCDLQIPSSTGPCSRSKSKQGPCPAAAGAWTTVSRPSVRPCETGTGGPLPIKKPSSSIRASSCHTPFRLTGLVGAGCPLVELYNGKSITRRGQTSAASQSNAPTKSDRSCSHVLRHPIFAESGVGSLYIYV